MFQRRLTILLTFVGNEKTENAVKAEFCRGERNDPAPGQNKYDAPYGSILTNISLFSLTEIRQNPRFCERGKRGVAPCEPLTGLLVESYRWAGLIAWLRSC